MDGHITIHTVNTGGCKRSEVRYVVCFGLHCNHSLFLACQTQLSDTGTMRSGAKTVNRFPKIIFSESSKPHPALVHGTL